MNENKDLSIKPLVTVQREYETDISTGETQTRMFVKMYFEARDSGLLADIGDRRWRTLCCLATYMDENGKCWPPQTVIAKSLGIHRQRVNERINDLSKYRFNGKPVIQIEKRRADTKNGSRWASNSYKILPIAGLGIFNSPVSGKPDIGETQEPVSDNPDIGHRPVSAKPDTGNPDTNKSQSETRTKTNVNVDVGSNKQQSQEALVEEESESSLSRKPESTITGLYYNTPDEIEQAVFTIRRDLQDTSKSDYNIRQIVRNLPVAEIEEAKYIAWGKYRDKIVNNPVGYFVRICKKKALDLNVDIGLDNKRGFVDDDPETVKRKIDESLRRNPIAEQL